MDEKQGHPPGHSKWTTCSLITGGLPFITYGVACGAIRSINAQSVDDVDVVQSKLNKPNKPNKPK